MKIWKTHSSGFYFFFFQWHPLWISVWNCKIINSSLSLSKNTFINMRVCLLYSSSEYPVLEIMNMIAQMMWGNNWTVKIIAEVREILTSLINWSKLVNSYEIRLNIIRSFLIYRKCKTHSYKNYKNCKNAPPSKRTTKIWRQNLFPQRPLRLCTRTEADEASPISADHWL